MIHDAQRKDKAIAPASSEDEMPMPPAPAQTDGFGMASGSSLAAAPPAAGEHDQLPPPPTFARQLAQLVIIPALICLSAIGVIYVLWMLMSRPDDPASLLNRISTTSGGGRMAMGVQDPRYKDRCQAAAQLAQMLPTIRDVEKRRHIGADLMQILAKRVDPQEQELQAYMIMAIGQLGPEGGLDAILAHGDSSHKLVRLMTAGALAAWPDHGEARAGIPLLLGMLDDDEPIVASEAARVVGILARPEDQHVIKALSATFDTPGASRREVYWNAAVALARLGDPQGSRFVADVLLHREALAKLPGGEEGPQASQLMSTATQDLVIIRTLAASEKMTDPIVWDRIKVLSENDPTLAVRKLAKQLLIRQQEQGK